MFTNQLVSTINLSLNRLHYYTINCMHFWIERLRSVTMSRNLFPPFSLLQLPDWLVVLVVVVVCMYLILNPKLHAKRTDWFCMLQQLWWDGMTFINLTFLWTLMSSSFLWFVKCYSMIEKLKIGTWNWIKEALQSPQWRQHNTIISIVPMSILFFSSAK